MHCEMSKIERSAEIYLVEFLDVLYLHILSDWANFLIFFLILRSSFFSGNRRVFDFFVNTHREAHKASRERSLRGHAT